VDSSPPATTTDHALPAAGTLTFLFTDVEGSTPLWERHEATMRVATARHDALLDALITAHGGTRVRERGEGDSLFAVFTRPDEAVAAALAMARAVLAEPWPPETPIRVRMGLHTGSAQFRAGDYYGPVVNRCARIRGLGHGGQVLLSAATAALVRDALPAGAGLRSLGAHPLRGLSTFEEVYQLCHRDLPVAFPPLLSPGAPQHNLPLALTALIGREAEQGEVLALLSAARLVTLTGSGGVGKTRLALAVAAELVDQYPDGVWLVELAALAEDRLVPQTVLETLGTREEAGRPLLATLTDHLHEKRVLLVLDNCEHLVAACAALAEAVVRRCPGVRVLATSREALAVAGEHRYRVPSLPVPDLAHRTPPERLAEAAAVALFVARARERRADFALTAQNAQAIAAVCARLDGIPLAIELAAARVDSLGVEGIAARLDDRFRLLTGGPRSALPRQRTLRAALDWSYELLCAAEQLLLDRLSVFAGGWTLAAAEAICAGDGIAEWEVLDLLGSLVNKSLVQAEEAAGELRYGLLETVRQYGHERRAASGELARVRDRHLAWSLALAEEAAPHLQGAADQVIWLERLGAEHDNVRAALRWARECGAAEEGLRLAGVLGYFWSLRGYLGEGRGWLEGALAAGAGAPAAVRATALAAAGDLAQWHGDFRQGVALFEESLALARAQGDTRRSAATLEGLAFVLERQGDYARATRVAEEALALSRALGDQAGMAAALSHLAVVAGSQGEYVRATSCHDESLALWRDVGSPPREVGYTLDSLAWMLDWRGAYAQAATLAEEALACWQDVGSQAGMGWAHMILGWSLLALGEERRATLVLEEGLALVRETGHFWGVPWALHLLGWAAYRRGEHERAATMQEQALAHFRQVHYRWGVAWVLGSLGYVLQARDEYGRAATCLNESLALGREIDAQGLLAEALESMAWLTVATGQPERAARLGGAAEALRAALGAALHPVLHAGHERAVRAMCDALGETAFAAAWAEGQALPPEQAIALALEGHGEQARAE
jgi:predicted ATPase/class 3 adenylate cyclase